MSFSRTYDQAQWSHAMGVSTGAAKTDPSTQGSAFLYEWYFGEEPAADDSVALLSANLNTFYNVDPGRGPEPDSSGVPGHDLRRRAHPVGSDPTVAVLG